MQKSNVMLVAIVSVLWASSALAAAECEGPTEAGNTWNLVCSDDGTGDAGYQCEYTISIATEDGFTDTVDASGTVDSGVQGAVIWSDISHKGSNIVSASIVSGSCHPW